MPTLQELELRESLKRRDSHIQQLETKLLEITHRRDELLSALAALHFVASQALASTDGRQYAFFAPHDRQAPVSAIDAMMQAEFVLAGVKGNA